MKKLLNIFFFLALAFPLAASHGAVHAASFTLTNTYDKCIQFDSTTQPPIPHAFYGNLLIDDNPAPVGTKVEVKGTGVMTGGFGNPLYTTEEGKYGDAGYLGAKLVAQGETLVDGTLLTFYVNNILTEHTFLWQEGELDKLDLSLDIAGITCTLNISSTAGGSVVEPGEASPYTYNCTDEVDLLAMAESCYNFTGWTADSPDALAAIDEPTSVDTFITMNGNFSITANFEPVPHLAGLEIPFNVGWNTFSTPIALHDCNDTWGEFIAANKLDVAIIYGYDAATESWVSADDGDKIEPLYGFYVRTTAAGLAHVVPSADFTPMPTRELSRGVHLIGPAPDSLTDIDAVSALDSVYTVDGGNTGYTMAVSPFVNSPNNWAYVRDAIDPPMMSIGRACWLVMENAGELAGSSSTPLSP